MEYQVAPLYTALPLIYREEAVVLLFATRARSLGGEVALKIDTLRRIADSMSLPLLDRYLRDCVPLNGVHVSAGEHGVSVEMKGSGVPVAEAVPPEPEWLSLAGSRGEVIVLVGMPSAGTRGSTIDLRTMLSSRRGFGGRAAASILTSRGTESRFTFLGLQGSVQPAPTNESVLFDSNLLVDLNAVARGPLKNAAREVEIQELAMRTMHLDLIPVFAISELAWDRAEGKWNHRRARELRCTCSAWFDGGLARASDLRLVRAAYQQALTSEPAGDDSQHTHTHPLQLGFYASLLKLAALWIEAQSSFRALHRVHLYEEFTTWMRDELGLVLTHPLQVARDRLVGPQRAEAVIYVNGLLKFSKDPLKDLWGAAWDLMHLSFVDQAVGSEDPLRTQGRPTALATADRWLPYLRDRIQRIYEVQLQGARHTFMISGNDIDPRLETQRPLIEQIDAQLANLPIWRRPEALSLDKLVQLIRYGEQHFLAKLEAAQNPVPTGHTV